MADVERPLISIVMLCYNHERFVAEALEGVLGQTYSPLDIVIIDDCSEDKTPDIVVALAAHSMHSNIRFIRNPRNLGLLGTCEVGFAAARGSFIVVTCDDDVMMPEMVAAMAHAWRTQDVSIVTTNVEYIDEHSRH